MRSRIFPGWSYWTRNPAEWLRQASSTARPYPHLRQESGGTSSEQEWIPPEISSLSSDGKSLDTADTGAAACCKSGNVVRHLEDTHEFQPDSCSTLGFLSDYMAYESSG